MTEETKRRTINALSNAAEFIRSHVEHGGIVPEDIDEDDENGLLEYQKACIRVSKIITNLSKKYEK